MEHSTNVQAEQPAQDRNGSTQDFWGATSDIVKSLVEGISELPRWAQLLAFLLVVALVATVIATVSISSDEVKLQLILFFFFFLTLCVLLGYAFKAHQNSLKRKLESSGNRLCEIEKQLSEKTDLLSAETSKHIDFLQLTETELTVVQEKLQEIPPSNETNFLNGKVSTLLRSVSESLEEVGGWKRKLIAADRMEEDLKRRRRQMGGR